MSELKIYKGRTNVVLVNLGIDVSGDTIISEIRDDRNRAATLLATWAVSFLTDGVDGILVLTLDDSALDALTAAKGWMDMKRISGGEPLPVFSDLLRVRFLETVTA